MKRCANEGERENGLKMVCNETNLNTCPERRREEG